MEPNEIRWSSPDVLESPERQKFQVNGVPKCSMQKWERFHFLLQDLRRVGMNGNARYVKMKTDLDFRGAWAICGFRHSETAVLAENTTTQDIATFLQLYYPSQKMFHVACR